MTKIKNIYYLMFANLLMLFVTASCMNSFDDPNLDVPPYGNNSIGEPTLTIAALKNQYNTVVAANGLQQVNSNQIIEAVVIGNDESGNIYKQLIVADETGAIVVGINNTGLYAYCQIGRASCRERVTSPV